MKNFIYQHKSRLAGVLLLALVISPFAVKAESLAEAIDRLSRELTTLSEILSSPDTLTVDEQSDLIDSITRISTELTDLQTTPPTPTTMEIIIDPVAEYTQAQFKDATDTLVSADFYFSGPNTPTTTSRYVDETVARAAATFGVSETDISQNVVVVDTFSDPDVFEPESLVLAPTTPPTPTVVSGRTNVDHVQVTGDVGDFESTARVVYAPEPGYPDYATSTFDYSFTTTLDEWDLMGRLPELDSLTFNELESDTGVVASALRSSSTISFDRFDNQFEVSYRYKPYASPISAGFDLSEYFGIYSVIDEVSVVAGHETFQIFLRSDQDEVLLLSLKAQYTGNDEHGFTPVAGRWNYTLAYTAHDVLLESDTVTGATRNGIRADLLDSLFGIGSEFGVTDEVVIDNLLPFMLDHSVFYATNGSNTFGYQNDLVSPFTPSCHSNEMESVIETLAEREFQGLQLAGDTEDLLQLYAPTVDMGRDALNRCVDINNSFFPALLP